MSGQKSGDFDINVSPGNSALFPLINLDLVVGMFGGNYWDAYLFDDKSISASKLDLLASVSAEWLVFTGLKVI